MALCSVTAAALLVGARTAWAQAFQEQARIRPDDSIVFDGFGISAALSGNSAIVGAPGRDGPAGDLVGVAYVMTRRGTVWSQEARLVSSAPHAIDLFGSSVALSGDTAIVGAPYEELTGGNPAFVFVRCGTEWTEQARLEALDGSPGDFFGIVALSGDTAVVGAPMDDRLIPDGYDAGSAYVFERVGTFWAQRRKLRASDPSANAYFGCSVAIDGDTIVVGARDDTTSAGYAAGEAYVFVRDGNVWTEQARLVASDGERLDSFGASVSISGETLVVGAPRNTSVPFVTWAGAAYVFVRTGTTWTQEAKLVADDASNYSQFGDSVSISGDAIVVGVRYENTGAERAGAVYVFRRTGASWSQEAKLRASDSTEYAVLGESVSLDGDTFLAGAPFDGCCGASGPGTVYAFTRTAGPCVTFDFETEDDLTSPLVDGQHLDVEFGRLVTLTSTGPNAGLAIFDSTVCGPNDPSQDPDLLVDSGNVLILQTENSPPDENDVFPLPNDDEDGGTITLDFAWPVEPMAVTLIDIDAADGTSSVVLVDGAGRRRVYTVPGNWTGDVVLGQAGQGTLDLTTLAPQPGFGSTAFASDDPGFDALDVHRISISLGGSGALDDLRVCSDDLPRATVVERNGSGRNARILHSSALPRIGTRWTAALDCSDGRWALATLTGRRCATAGTMTPFGERLVAGALVFAETRGRSGTVNEFTLDIPLDVALLGLEVHVQGTCSMGTPITTPGKLCLLRADLSNALDVVIGF